MNNRWGYHPLDVRMLGNSGYRYICTTYSIDGDTKATKTRLSSHWICKIRDKHLQFGQSRIRSRSRSRYRSPSRVLSQFFFLFLTFCSDIYNSIVLISFRTVLIFLTQKQKMKRGRRANRKLKFNRIDSLWKLNAPATKSCCCFLVFFYFR